MVVKKWKREKIMLMMPLFVLQTHHPKCVLFLLSYLFSTLLVTSSDVLLYSFYFYNKNVLRLKQQLIKEDIELKEFYES
jgi:membrane protein YqaA with SNARE-associated domain